jgi:uncharacterized protein YejL (UPF0352 family)
VADKPTDKETTEIEALLSSVQAAIEKDEYTPDLVISVLMNIAGRYAAGSGMHRKQFKRIAETTFNAQSAQVAKLKKQKLADEADEAAAEAEAN